MKKFHPGWLLAVAGAGALYGATFIGTRTTPDRPASLPARPQAAAPSPSLPPPSSTPRPTTLPATVEYTSPERETFATLAPGDKETVAAFLTETAGPLDNYLIKLEGTVALGNARYGTPDAEGWHEALPVARVLVQGMCDCAQRNWLNQFIVLGEAGLSGDLDEYHRQGEVMASIGRYNDDPVVVR